MSSKDKNERLSLALRKNLKKRKIFQKKNKKKNKAINLAFDVTPSKYVTGLITEKGICEASNEGLKRLFK